MGWMKQPYTSTKSDVDLYTVHPPIHLLPRGWYAAWHKHLNSLVSTQLVATPTDVYSYEPERIQFTPLGSGVDVEGVHIFGHDPP